MRLVSITLLAVIGLGFSPELHAQDDEDFFVSAAMADMNADAGNVGEVLRAEALDWEDTPHVLGGDSRRGIDCSALMQEWFGNLFGVSLPRTSGEQFETGTRIERDDLRPGDLVFFGSARRISHVGVYVGENEFAHVASSVGVTVSRMDEAYWKRRYRGARRVLEGAEMPPPTTFAAAGVASTPAPEVAIESSERPASAAPTFTRASVQGSRTSSGTRRVGW